MSSRSSSSSSSDTVAPLKQPLHDSDADATAAAAVLPTTTQKSSPFWSRQKNRNFLAPAVVLLLLLGGATVLVLAGLLVVALQPRVRHSVLGKPIRYVAFIGNSMTYFYDLPRSLQVVSGYTVEQNSVLAGSGSLANMEIRENGMWNRWRSDSALLYTLDEDEVDYSDEDHSNGGAGFIDNNIWDFGACSMSMLIGGHDIDEAQAFYDEWWAYRDEYGLEDDDGWIDGSSSNSDTRMTNPCAQSQAYLDFLASLPDDNVRVNPKRWDYLVLSDRSYGPKHQETRDEAMEALGRLYLPLLEESKAIPVLLVTQAYWLNRDTDDDDDNGQNNDDDDDDDDGNNNVNTFQNVPYWTVQTYEGIKQYAEYLAARLPRSQKPKVINMGIAYLVVYEEYVDLWDLLFWTDKKHQSPYGSFLQSCLLHHVVYGYLPDRSVVIRENMTTLWDDTRTLQYPRDTVVPFPTTQEAEYLYGVCERVASGYLPPTFKEQLKANGLSLYK